MKCKTKNILFIFFIVVALPIFSKPTINEYTVEDFLFLHSRFKVRLKPIYENKKRIDLITDWTNIIIKELWETTEGGEVEFYFENERLEKIITQHFGALGKRITTYYLLNEQLSFASERLYIYNRPMYYDTAMMIENNDTEAFDFDKSEIFNSMTCFENGKFITGLRIPVMPSIDGYSFQNEKQLRIEFDRLLQILNTTE